MRYLATLVAGIVVGVLSAIAYAVGCFAHGVSHDWE